MKLIATVVGRAWGKNSIGVVIPVEIRKKLEVSPGDTLQLTIEKIQ